MITSVNYETDLRLDFPAEEVIRSVVDEAAAQESFPVQFELSVTLTDNDGIGDFSKVISDKESAPEDYVDPETGLLILGDIVISLEKVTEQAKEYGHSPKRELAFLTAHSMMHLFGYDHMEDGEREVMEKHQEAVLCKLGITRD